MIAKDLISDIIPVLNPTDSGEKALALMDTYRVFHLPVLKNNELVGVVSETDIYDAESSMMSVGDIKFAAILPFVMENQHIYEVINLSMRLQLTVVPVLNNDNSYCGAIVLRDIVKAVGNILSVQEPGGVIVLEINTRDYALTEIVKIVENSDAKILNTYTHTIEGGNKIELTLKLNRVNISSIIQTLLRFDYKVKTSFSHQDDMREVMANRYNELMRFINI